MLSQEQFYSPLVTLAFCYTVKITDVACMMLKQHSQDIAV